jgi:hypothetical protein
MTLTIRSEVVELDWVTIHRLSVKRCCTFCNLHGDFVTDLSVKHFTFRNLYGDFVTDLSVKRVLNSVTSSMVVL